ncbi:hypothetical protein [Spirillospora sp. NBC_01491]|uniref:hypothetical protein n=1 Tax=Spirillospora sp. NBC_01491 TaxID=2976007 RepID=UPI002E31A5BD|nr:hypothetical protein [Spirillospora sp. NBC_01491]
MDWLHLLGKNPIPTSTPTRSTDRLIAVGCAMRLAPDNVVATGAYDAGEVTTRARAFEEWLSEARGDEQDAQLRRLLLVMVCEKASNATPSDRIRALVKELHHHLTRR